MELKVTPIGFVKNEFEREIPLNYHQHVSEVHILKEYADGLDGIEEFSHIIVIYWMNRSRWDASAMKIHPMANRDLPLVGVFATRSPIRPNPIGITTVRLLRREENVLFVRGLDAFNRTPVLDIKPYMLGYDLVRDMRFPVWVYMGMASLEEARRSDKKRTWQKEPEQWLEI